MRSLIYATSALLAAVIGQPSLAHAIVVIEGPMTVCFQHSIFHMNADEKIDDWKLGIDELSVRIVGPNGWSHTVVETYARRVPPGSLTLVSTKGNTKRYRMGDSGNYVIFARPDPSDSRERPLLFGSGPPDNDNDNAFYSRFEVVDRGTVKCGYGFLHSAFVEDGLKPD
jgi:hypothetical protein